MVALAVVPAGWACGSKATPPTPVDDAGAISGATRLPSWFPAQLPSPTGGVIVEVIDTPETGNVTVGRSVTWRIDKPHSQVVKDLETTLAKIGWTPTDQLSADDGPDAKRTSIYIENNIVEVIRVYSDANLKGTRVTVELPAS